MCRSSPGSVREFRCRAAAANLLYVAYRGFRPFRWAVARADARPTRLPRRTRSGVFGLFAGLCVVGFLFVRRYLPETRGRTLEQIQQMWVADYDRRKRAHTGS
ncbi:MFS transporter [Micromonospora chalcea]